MIERPQQGVLEGIGKVIPLRKLRRALSRITTKPPTRKPPTEEERKLDVAMFNRAKSFLELPENQP
jgi:hypothetical protein